MRNIYYMLIIGMRRLYKSCRRSSSSWMVGISFLSPADVPELLQKTKKTKKMNINQ